MNKEVVLFIVEGESDRMSFENVLNRLVTNDKIKFIVISGDITSTSLKYNITKKIEKKVIDFINLPKNKYLHISDIKKIVHIVDLDATFINREQIVQNNNEIKQYTSENYLVPNVEEIIQRNSNKKQVLEKLINTNFITCNSIVIPYEIYYFSCNLEHVLHNNPNVDTIKEKIRLSDEFAERYLGYEHLFLEFINDESFAAQGNYSDSWSEATNPQNALCRKTNFNLFFKKDD